MFLKFIMSYRFSFLKVWHRLGRHMVVTLKNNEPLLRDRVYDCKFARNESFRVVQSTLLTGVSKDMNRMKAPALGLCNNRTISELDVQIIEFQLGILVGQLTDKSPLPTATLR